MRRKQRFLFAAIMAIVMMAMSPTKGWADETLVSDNSGYSANDTKITVTYNKTGSKAVLRFKDYDKYLDRYWSSLDLKIDGTEVLNLNDLWSDLTSSSENKHTTIVNNTTLAANEKSITLNGITIGTAKLQNRSYDTFYCYTELALNFNQYFSYYGHELTLTGTYKVTSSGFRRINLTGYMNGYPRPKSLTAIQNGTDVNLSWESEKYNDNTTTAGSWYIYRGTTQLGSVAYGTTSYTDTGWSCSAENKYTVVFVPTNWTAKADYPGINASKSITIPHTYGDRTWTWSDDGKTATCSRACTSTNCTAETTDHTVSTTVTLSEGGITSAVTTPATCLTMGKTTYTAKATVLGLEYTDSKIVTDVPAAGHTYGEPVWEWTGNESATCTLTCTACTEGTEGHTASADVTLGGGGITYAVTTPPQCTETGTGTYTSTATVAGSEYSDHKDKTIPATGHTTPENYDEYGIKLCSVCYAFLEYQPLGEADADGWYSIVNPRQLNEFATKVNNGETNIKGRLTWDIDILGREYVQIGNTADNAFRGILDGQFHTIRTLNINTSEENGAALIRYTKNATIKNLTVQGTFTTSNKYAAGFIAQNLSDGDDTHYTKIEKCISAVNIRSSRSGDGTHAGFVGVAGAPVTLSDCAFIGSITTTNGTNNCAALVGWSSQGDKSTATNCFVTATFDSGICQKQMMRNCSDDHFPTCYYVNTYCNNTVHQGTQITPAQVSNGYLCYLLNGNVNAKTDGTQTWYQDIKIDEDDLVFDNLPVLKRTNCNTVYCTYGETCTDVTFNNTGASGTPNHEYNIAWSWAADGKTAKATHTCQRNSSHVVETVATMTSQQALAPTCDVMGMTTYTATVNVIGTEEQDTKTVEDIPALGHSYVEDAENHKVTCSRTGCTLEAPMLTEGVYTGQTYAANSTLNNTSASDYATLYYFRAPGTGTLTVSDYSNDHRTISYGALFNEDKSTLLKSDFFCNNGSVFFKFTYNVTEGEVYWIGARGNSYNSISNHTLTIAGTWPFPVASATLTDGEAYDGSMARQQAATFTYKRSFYNNEYNCLYVPFSAAAADFTDCSIYAINMFQEHDSDGDGVLDALTLEVTKAPEGAVLKANHPYLIKYKGELTAEEKSNGKEVSFIMSDILLESASTYSSTCSSMSTQYTFKGTYNTINATTATNDSYYTIIRNTGGHHIIGKTTSGIKPQRWYMTMTARDPQIEEAVSNAAKSITIIADDEEEDVITSIIDEQIIMNNAAGAVYNLHGQKLTSPRKGINIINGRKVLVK